MRSTLWLLAILTLILATVQGQTSTTYRLYTAKAGELPEEIAKRFNVSIQDILRANPNMVADQPLHQGEVVLVPVKESSQRASISSKPKSGTPQKPKASSTSETHSFARAYWIYTVQVGDTIESIAQRFGIPVSALAYANNLPTNASLVSGQVLMVPVLEQRVEYKSAVSAKASPQTSQTQTGFPASPPGPSCAPHFWLCRNSNCRYSEHPQCPQRHCPDLESSCKRDAGDYHNRASRLVWSFDDQRVNGMDKAGRFEERDKSHFLGRYNEGIRRTIWSG
jgi:LysM repeat protein